MVAAKIIDVMGRGKGKERGREGGGREEGARREGGREGGGEWKGREWRGGREGRER